MIREVAGHDPARFEEVMQWPLRELFLAYVARLRKLAREGYQVELLVWAVLAPYQKDKTNPPALPAILR